MMRTSGGLGSYAQYYTNLEITPLISDPYAKCGQEVANTNLYQIFVRPLGFGGSGTNLVGIYNAASTNQSITLTWSMLGADAGQPLSFRDLWAGTNFPYSTSTNLTVSVAPAYILLLKSWPTFGPTAPWVAGSGGASAGGGAYATVGANSFDGDHTVNGTVYSEGPAAGTAVYDRSVAGCYSDLYRDNDALHFSDSCSGFHDWLILSNNYGAITIYTDPFFPMPTMGPYKYIGDGSLLTNIPAAAITGGFTGNLTVLTNGANTATLHITNGLVMTITAP
jgi:hypothetical protein